MISQLLGGVGLFLLGMILMTEGLKAVAGDALRRVLARFTGGPVSAFLSGAAVTAAVQSSSATTLMTIGFVSAGLLQFPQAVGIIIGSNLGTTSTGWLVSAIGLKLDVAAVALPVVGLGALGRLLAKGRLASAGMALAGFGLIFVGIDVLQTGMEGLSGAFDPSGLPARTLSGRLLLVLMGAAMTVVMQSSSAAVATTLTALHTETIGLEQAAALVIGQNIGTTVTAAIGSIGASIPARRTALAHILFNVVTGVVAIATLPLFLEIVLMATGDATGADAAATALAGFHTAFNLLGVALFLPFTKQFAGLVTRIVPEKEPALVGRLDRSVAHVPDVAVEAVRLTVRDLTSAAVDVLWTTIEKGQSASAARAAEIDGATARSRELLAEASEGSVSPSTYARHLAALHALDHLERLVGVCAEPGPIPKLIHRAELSPILTRLEEETSAARRCLSEDPFPEGALAEVASRSSAIAELRKRLRKELFEASARGDVDPDDLVRLTGGLSWLDRAGFHLWRALHHLAETPPPESMPATQLDPAPLPLYSKERE